jgi:hypothetical protein
VGGGGVNIAHIYRPVNGGVAALGVGFNDFLCLLPFEDVRRDADVELERRGWRRTGVPLSGGDDPRWSQVLDVSINEHGAVTAYTNRGGAARTPHRPGRGEAAHGLARGGG